MTVLSINVNKVATLRNSRGRNVPDVLAVCLYLEKLGTQGITVHPRPDERHIRKQDVRDLKRHLSVELNVEGYPSKEFLNLMEEVKPDQVTLVPDPPEALTSSAGWRWQGSETILTESIQRLKSYAQRVSVFMDPFNYSREDLDGLSQLGVHRLEIYTEQYANDFGTPNEASTLKRLRIFSDQALSMGFGLNAGHDLTSRNVGALLTEIPEIKEVSIGHAFISDSLEWGFKEAFWQYEQAVKQKDRFSPREPEIVSMGILSKN